MSKQILWPSILASGQPDARASHWINSLGGGGGAETARGGLLWLSVKCSGGDSIKAFLSGYMDTRLGLMSKAFGIIALRGKMDGIQCQSSWCNALPRCPLYVFV